MNVLAFSYTIKLSEAELQQRLNAMMPYEKRHPFMTIRISDPELKLVEVGNRVGVFVNVEATIPGGFKGSGRGRILGSLEYQRDEGAFFFKDPVIEHLQIDRVPQQLSDEISRLAQSTVGKALSRYPVYRLRDDDARQKMAKSMLKSVAVKRQHLELTLQPF